MTQHIYWHAPVWEVLLLGLTGLALLAWLMWRAVRRPHPSAALSAIDPALNDQPLFFFDRVHGIVALNDGAQQVLNTLSASQDSHSLDILTDALLEAQEESRLVQQAGWPKPGYSLIAAPVAGQAGSVTGVFALVAPEPPLLPAERRIDEPAMPATDWIEIGATLRLHRQRPAVRVERIDPTTTGQAAMAWQENQISPTEEALLRHLLTHSNEVQAAEALFSAVWPDDEVGTFGLRPDQKDRLRRLVFQLRQHVEPDPRAPRYVRTAHGAGYVLYSNGELALP